MVNATGTGTLEYSTDGGSNYQISNTFSGLTPGNYNIRVRLQADPACLTDYASNPVVIDALPVIPTVYNVGGGGTFCTGAGQTVTLSDSEAGVNYQLYVNPGSGAGPIGAPVPGTGNPISFTGLKLGGTYTVIATSTSAGNCTATMSGSAIVTPQFNLVTEATSPVACGGEVTVTIKAGTCDVAELDGLQFVVQWNAADFDYVGMPTFSTLVLPDPAFSSITANQYRYTWAGGATTSVAAGDVLMTFKLKAKVVSGTSSPIILTSLVPGDMEAAQSNTYVVPVTNGTNASVTFAPNVTLSINDITVSESAGTASFTASLSAATGCDVTFDVATSNVTAVAPGDYTAIATTTHTIPAGSTTVPIVVTIANDNIAEPTETYNVNLSNLVNATILDGLGVGTITDDDALTISIADLSVTETDANVSHNIVATMSGVAQQDVVISFSTTDGTALAPGDYTSQAAQTYTIPAGSTTVNIPVVVVGDDIAEPVEAFTGAIIISNANGQPVSIGTGTATVTITDDDAATLSIDDVTEDESNGTITFTVSLSGDVQNDITVNFATSDNSAVQPGDYSSNSGTLTFGGANSNTQFISVPIIDDILVEPTEDFFVNLSGLVANSQNVTIADAQGLGTITDNDVSEVSIAATNQASEPATNGEFTLTLSNPVSVATTVTFVVSGAATEGTDYAAIGTTVVIPANTTSITIPVTVIDDPIVETGGETVIVTLSGTDNAVTVGSPNNATVTIDDDDVYTITGELIWKGDGTSGVALADVDLTGPVNSTFTPTGTDGAYTLTTDAGGSYTITPSKNVNVKNGLDAGDITALQQHLVAIPGAVITDFYRLLAADCNNSSTISTVDAALIRQVLLDNPFALNVFTNTGFWRFVPKSFADPSPVGPYSLPPYETDIMLTLTSDVTGQDFWGVKTGDVLYTATPANKPADGSSPSPVVWTVQDRLLQAGETFSMDFKVNNFSDIAAYQFALQFDPSVIEFDHIEILTTDIPLDAAGNFGLYNIASGELRSVWSIVQGQTLSNGASAFRLVFKALEGGQHLSDLIQFKPDALTEVAYTGNLEQREVKLEFVKEEVLGTNAGGGFAGLQLLQNQPNPFSDRTNIGFVLPEACEAELRILDVNGRLLKSHRAEYTAGKHQIVFEIVDATATGLLYYELITPYGQLSGKMMANGK